MARAFNLTPRVKEDLRSIWEYSSNTWGEEHAEKYIRDIYQRFVWLAATPYAGKHRPDISHGYYCFPHQSHLVFYLIHSTNIDIIGVLHKEMDINRYFD